MHSRRSVLTGLASVPLIGGGLTLIGTPAPAVTLTQVAAAPLLGDPRARARYAWEAFSAAMREVSAGSQGWLVCGGGENLPFRDLRGGAWLDVCRVRYETDTDPRCPALIVERHDAITL